jgi:hypothetical protein
VRRRADEGCYPASTEQPLGLSANENDPCLKENAGKALTSGSQAACYANHYIALHLSEVNDGKTYSETSNQLRALEDQDSP